MPGITVAGLFSFFEDLLDYLIHVLMGLLRTNLREKLRYLDYTMSPVSTPMERIPSVTTSHIHFY